MSNGFCGNCGEYTFRPPCRCKAFKMAIPWRDKVEFDSWQFSFGLDIEAAIERFCEQQDSNDGEYSILKQYGTEVWTMDEETDIITKWRVEAEAVPQYTARKKRD